MPETTQPAPETDEKKSRGLGSYVVWAFVAVLVYVLSSGPAVRVALGKKRVSRPVAIGFWCLYGPLLVLYEQTPCHKPLGLYWHLWNPYRFRGDGSRIAYD